MYSTCSWVSVASNTYAVYDSTRFLYSAVSATAFLSSLGSSVSAALDSRGTLYPKTSVLWDSVALLQLERSKDEPKKS